MERGNETIISNKVYMGIGITAAIFGFIAKIPYRNYVYFKGINDYGIADWIPSLLYIIGIIFIVLYFSDNSKKWKVNTTIFTITLGALFYELEQCYSNMTFDIKDVIAIIIGAFICKGIIVCLDNIFRRKNI